jgi:hypothetical protein
LCDQQRGTRDAVKNAERRTDFHFHKTETNGAKTSAPQTSKKVFLRTSAV